MAKLIQPDGTVTEQKPQGKRFSLTEVQQLVGGYVRVIITPDAVAYVDEDGLALYKTPNPVATELLRHIPAVRAQGMLVGPVLICEKHEAMR